MRGNRRSQTFRVLREFQNLEGLKVSVKYPIERKGMKGTVLVSSPEHRAIGTRRSMQHAWLTGTPGGITRPLTEAVISELLLHSSLWLLYIRECGGLHLATRVR